MGELVYNNEGFINYGEVGDGEFLRSMKQNIKPYWDEKYLRIPDDSVKLRLDPVSGRPLWEIYFEKAVERQNIWKKRVVDKLPKPWTEDEILGTYHFTNLDRRDDRVTLYYIDNVLGAFKADYEKANGALEMEIICKYLLLNTFIYRLFVRTETWEVIGYLHHDTLDKDWEVAKHNLRQRKAGGEPVFTDAYYVNDLKSANPNPETNGDKTENAICLIQFIIDNLDEIAEFTFNPENDMESCVEKFTMIPGVGMFNAYEVALDLGTVKEFTGIPFVEWTPDHWANVGPGCKRGIDYIFENKGNMDYLSIVYFVKSVYNHEIERLGLELHLPEGRTEFDLRCWEGWFCEMSKYIAGYASSNGGFDFVQKKRIKKRMKLRTDDVSWLEPR